jgi:hypothetical protein
MLYLAKHILLGLLSILLLLILTITISTHSARQKSASLHDLQRICFAEAGPAMTFGIAGDVCFVYPLRRQHQDQREELDCKACHNISMLATRQPL